MYVMVYYKDNVHKFIFVLKKMTIILIFNFYSKNCMLNNIIIRHFSPLNPGKTRLK